MAAEQSETKSGRKAKYKRDQSERTIRAILGKINRKLASPDLTKEEWLGLVKDSIVYVKALGMAKNAKKGIPGAEQRPDASLF